MNFFWRKDICCRILILFTISTLPAIGDDVNYDESRVPDYTLPDPLLLANGERVVTANQWKNIRRAEILQLFRSHVYGHAPKPLPEMIFHRDRVTSKALGGLAIRKEVTVYFNGQKNGPKMEILIHLPVATPHENAQGEARSKREPVPLFLGLNFRGNHSIHPDPTIPISSSWFPNNEKTGYVAHRATERTRGCAASRWPVEEILRRGYGLATIYYGDIDPDYDDGFRNGVHPIFYPTGQEKTDPQPWGSVGAWAWGLSRALDYFQTDPEIDHQRVAVMGHSRLGKTALWAGAQDERFALVISNNSGCGGAALSRRRYGEKVARINTVFPHWFCDRFKEYNDREEDLPVDQHQLISLIAPRPVYVASAQEDRWADPRGEYLSAFHAGSVYQLLGKQSLPGKELPEINQPVMTHVGYHIRSGKHDVTDFDWHAYMDFADKYLGK